MRGWMRGQLGALLLTLALAIVGSGCSALPANRAAVSNPIVVRSNNLELVWEKTVDTLHEYQFAIHRENRLAGEIETDYKIGASILEPWHLDAATPEDRLEGTMQSIRRKVLVHIVGTEEGYLVSVEAFKELEDLPGLAANSAGSATFQESAPLERDLNLVVGQSTPSGWIPKGRDLALEQSLLNALMDTLQNR